MITGYDVAMAAVNSGLLGTPYSKLDCQAFVEKVLYAVGIRHNYRGSNDMWRNLVHDRQLVRGGAAPLGSLAFIVKNDGGETKRGYHDDMGNATHVAIVIGDGKTMESTTGGVQYGKLSRFTYYGLINGVSYEEGGIEDAGERPTDLARLLQMVQVLRDNIDEMEVYIRDIYGGS